MTFICVFDANKVRIGGQGEPLVIKGPNDGEARTDNDTSVLVRTRPNPGNRVNSKVGATAKVANINPLPTYQRRREPERRKRRARHEYCPRTRHPLSIGRN